MKRSITVVILALAALALFQVAYSQTGDSMSKDTPATSSTPSSAAAKPVVVMETSLGTIKIELDPAKAPLSVANFLRYVDEKSYDGTIFHRVIPDFMIQGGGFTPDMKQKQCHEPIKNEAANGLKNKRGTIAMARTGVVDSATSQFFINTVDNSGLDYKDATTAGFGYAVFGKVIEGMDVVDSIRKVKTGSMGQFQDVPKEAVTIKSVRLQ
jgi:cyclophilin family peptidyl-prolyl cis-trans isomerase